MFSYSNFVALVKKDGLARNNRFYVMMPAPALRGEAASLFQNNRLFDMLLLCKGVSVPGVSVTTADIVQTGERLNIPYDRAFGGATFSFYVDRGMVVRKIFDEWVNTIQDPKTRSMGWYKEFVVDEINILVIPRSESGVVYSITLHECFPKGISSLQLDHSNNDVMTLDVEMEYHYYTTEVYTYTPAVSVPDGAADDFVYTGTSESPISNSIKTKYTVPSNQLPGMPTAIQKPGFTDAVRNTLSAFSNSFGDLASQYGRDFIGFQQAALSGEVIVNGIGIPLDINGAFEVAKRQSLQTVKSAVVGAVARKTGIRLF